MTVFRHELRRGTYHDSIVLMRLQAALAELPGIADAGVVMATEANLALLADSGLRPSDLGTAAADDLLIAVRAESLQAAQEALARVDELLARRGSGGAGDAYRPKSLDAAARALPEARWVAVSVPGQWAARVAGEALDLGRHVFLYSDNVPVEEEVRLKARASELGLLVMGPDCGTALVGGVGLGFANRVRRGAVGLVAASGTGLQTVASRVHALGGGVTQALGTGGRDLSSEVGGSTALAALDLLVRDADTRVVVLISKPPAPEVASRLLAAARSAGKPVVVCFLGRAMPVERLGNLHFTASLAAAAERAVELSGPRGGSGSPASPADSAVAAPVAGRAPRRFFRGLFSGGSLGQEALTAVTAVLAPVASNLHAPGSEGLDDPAHSRGHTLVDLGADELTVGRPHPMLDPTLAAARLRREAEDPETAVVLFDVVLGDGAHEDPAPLLAAALEGLGEDRPELAALIIGTDDDPQDLDRQIARLEEAGVTTFRDLGAAVEHALSRVPLAAPAPAGRPVSLADLAPGAAVINVGVDVFYSSLRAQGARTLQVDWRPPAGGDARLAGILARMKGSAGSTT